MAEQQRAAMGADGADEMAGGFPGSGMLYAAMRGISGMFQSFLTSSLNWEDFLEALHTPERLRAVRAACVTSISNPASLLLARAALSLYIYMCYAAVSFWLPCAACCESCCSQLTWKGRCWGSS